MNYCYWKHRGCQRSRFSRGFLFFTIPAYTLSIVFVKAFPASCPFTCMFSMQLGTSSSASTWNIMLSFPLNPYFLFFSMFDCKTATSNDHVRASAYSFSVPVCFIPFPLVCVSYGGGCVRECVDARTQVRTHARTHARTRACAHARTCTHAHTCTHLHTHLHTHNTHTHTHHTHTTQHTHTHTHTHTITAKSQ